MGLQPTKFICQAYFINEYNHVAIFENSSLANLNQTRLRLYVTNRYFKILQTTKHFLRNAVTADRC